MSKENLKRQPKRKWDYLKLDREIFLCKECLTLSTRPRSTYDENGVCNACNWAKEKKKINWKERQNKLKEICNRYRRKDGYWDIIVPCSGGKDGSYVAWVMKYKYHMNPLCVTIKTPMETEIGKENLKNFIESGFSHMLITPNPKVYKKLHKITFINQGRPKQAFEMVVSTYIMNLALKLDIPFIMFGEEGEKEYSGEAPNFEEFKISKDYLINCYYSGHEPEEFLKFFDITDVKMWMLPDDKDIKEKKLFVTHWSNFENWDPLIHYNLAKKECGFKTRKTRSPGTFTNYAQLDDKLQELHAYMMYIKFGFGRAWSDACIEIRAGRMTREKGIKLIKKYDGEFPEEYLKDYLDYFGMTKREFFDTIDSFRSPDIWEKVDGKWKLKFKIV